MKDNEKIFDFELFNLHFIIWNTFEIRLGHTSQNKYLHLGYLSIYW